MCKYNPDIYPKELRKATKDLSRDSRCPGRDSNQLSPEYVSRALPLCQGSIKITLMAWLKMIQVHVTSWLKQYHYTSFRRVPKNCEMFLLLSSCVYVRLFIYIYEQFVCWIVTLCSSERAKLLCLITAQKTEITAPRTSNPTVKHRRFYVFLFYISRHLFYLSCLKVKVFAYCLLFHWNIIPK
jgi:hypothetical protein